MTKKRELHARPAGCLNGRSIHKLCFRPFDNQVCGHLPPDFNRADQINRLHGLTHQPPGSQVKLILKVNTYFFIFKSATPEFRNAPQFPPLTRNHGFAVASNSVWGKFWLVFCVLVHYWRFIEQGAERFRSSTVQKPEDKNEKQADILPSASFNRLLAKKPISSESVRAALYISQVKGRRPVPSIIFPPNHQSYINKWFFEH